jgi:hypothetical protein
MKNSLLDEMLLPFTGYTARTSAWILLGALLVAIALSRMIKTSKLTFQCSNCGSLTCEKCCEEARDMNLCNTCMSAIADITSEKVIGALLRQKRQSAIVRRGRASRVTTRVLPGIRDIMNGRVWRAFKLSSLFSVSLILLISRGLVIADTTRIVPATPLWQMILPAFGIVLSYILSSMSKPRYDFRKRRTGMGKKTGTEAQAGPAKPARAA